MSLSAKSSTVRPSSRKRARTEAYQPPPVEAVSSSSGGAWFRREKGRLPAANNAGEAAEIVGIAKKLLEEKAVEVELEVDESVITKYALHAEEGHGGGANLCHLHAAWSVHLAPCNACGAAHGRLVVFAAGEHFAASLNCIPHRHTHPLAAHYNTDATQ